MEGARWTLKHYTTRLLGSGRGVPTRCYWEFDDWIFESLSSKNADIHYQAVCAAGNWEVDAAWPHIAGLVTSSETEKSLLLAAIEASVSIRAQEAREILGRLTDADDEDIVEAVYEAMSMAGDFWGEGDDEDEDD